MYDEGIKDKNTLTNTFFEFPDLVSLEVWVQGSIVVCVWPQFDSDQTNLTLPYGHMDKIQDCVENGNIERFRILELASVSSVLLLF